MFALVVAAPLQHIHKAFYICIRIGMGMLQRITNARLGCKMDDRGKAMLREKRLRCCPIGQVELHKGEIGMALENLEASLFQFGIIVIVEDIEADDPATVRQQALSNMKSDKPCSSGDQYSVLRHHISELGFRVATAQSPQVANRDRVSS